jgi:hypothetical protein
MNYPALRTTLKCGSIVFGASALFLLALPSLFLELLALETTDELTWFTYLYAAVGFGFGVAYVVGMVSKK